MTQNYNPELATYNKQEVNQTFFQDTVCDFAKENINSLLHPISLFLLTGALPVPPTPWLPAKVWSAGPVYLGIFQSADTAVTNPPAARKSHHHTLFPD